MRDLVTRGRILLAAEKYRKSEASPGKAMEVGLVHRRKDQRAVRIESFWYGFTFALGMALVRFFFAM